jgi:uncharacterized protein YecE (DUF72 family)
MNPADTPAFDRAWVAPMLARLAERGIFIGTSSWKYPGWCGALYSDERYRYHGKFSNARFERTCLEEYAGVFRSVGVDAAYYAFPTPKYLAGLAGAVPAGFRFSFKVTDAITLKRYPNLPRFGIKAGHPNPEFLDAERFTEAFLGPCGEIRDHVGLIMFEFSHFHPSDYGRGRDFIADLDRFLGQLPKGWDYGVEIRNRSFLHPEYFDALARHGVAHVYNSWEAMPPVDEQWLAPGSRTNPACFGARFLLRPGRRYAEAVAQFQPYDRVRDPFPAGREAIVDMVLAALSVERPSRAFVYVNNRFEGSALGTIAAVLHLLGDRIAKHHVPL